MINNEDEIKKIFWHIVNASFDGKGLLENDISLNDENGGTVLVNFEAIDEAIDERYLLDSSSVLRFLENTIKKFGYTYEWVSASHCKIYYT